MLNLALEPSAPQQWYLSSTGANILEALGHYSGQGVSVAIVDDGFDGSHRDLVGAFDVAASKDTVANLAGLSATGSNGHGTQVAGVIAAAADGAGMVGVAPESNLVGLKITYGNAMMPALEQALTLGAQHDIINCSWGFIGPFADTHNDSEQTALFEALQGAAVGGRSGLGSVIVFCAGNERTSGDNTTYHGLQGSPYVITVAASIRTDNYAAFSTPGASTLIAAPGQSILTTDLVGAAGAVSGDYAYVNGTSFAAPIVSGMVALMLDANASLGGRDVQEILAYSARPAAAAPGMENGATDWNGGGLRFSNDFGFGIVDAAAAVRMAESWFAAGNVPSTFANAHSVDVVATGKGGPLPDQAGSFLEMQFSVGAALELDKVTLNLTFDQTITSSMYLELVSPSGTVSRLTGTAAYTGPGLSLRDHWSFTSNAFWGEAAAGTWTLRAHDMAADAVHGGIQSASLTLLGDAIPADDRYVYTDAYAGLAAGEAERRSLADTDGGRDILDFSPVTAALRVDLAAKDQWLGAVKLTIAEAGSIENALGGAGSDQLVGSATSNVLWGGWGNDMLDGREGSDTLRGGSGDDSIEGGAGWDVMLFSGHAGEYRFGRYGESIVVVGADGRDVAHGVEELVFDGERVAAGSVGQSGVILVSKNGHSEIDLAGNYDGPAAGIQYQWLGSASNEVVRAVDGRVFLNLLGGDDAATGSAGDDVLDGGTGSSFLFGGAGHDTFFIDGRSGTTWGTLADWTAGEQVSLWGWRPGVSSAYWEDRAGAAGYEGATVHCDLDGNGTVDASITWSGIAYTDLPSGREYEGLLWFIG